MSQVRIPDLTEAASAADSDSLVGLFSSVTKRMTMANLAAAIESRIVPDVHTVIVRDEKAQNTHGGTFNNGAWRDRDLNVLSQSSGAGASLSTNTLTLPAGQWLIMWQAPAYATGRHQSKLLVDGATSIYGSSAYLFGAASTQTLSQGFAVLDKNASFTIKVQHQSELTFATQGFGYAANFGTEVYSELVAMRIGDATP